MWKSRIICLNPWDSQSKQIISPSGISGSLCAGEQRWGSVPPNIIMERKDDTVYMEGKGVKCLNPWDAEGKRIFSTDGVMQTLFAGEGGHIRGVCYAIEGNTVDRASAKNGRGWCEDVSPTLNTQDKHAICFQLCGDRDNPSVTMSDRGQAVVYGIDAASSNSWKSSNPHSGVHEMEVCKCLDTMCLNPQCNQGGGY